MGSSRSRRTYSPGAEEAVERGEPRRSIADTNHVTRVLRSIGFTNRGIKGATPGIEDRMMAQLLRGTVHGTTQTPANTFEKKASQKC